MRTVDVTAQIFIFKMPEEAKDEIIKAIDSMERTSYVDDNQSLSNTDWTLPKSYFRPYIQTSASLILKSINEDNPITEEELYINNMWFQQYEENDFHTWHTHGECMYSSVYYVELPESTATTFRIGDEEVQLEVEEGDYVVFPSLLSHCSKPNTTGKRKTIISANINPKGY